MSYVPPHLRNSGPTTTTKISSINLDNGRTNLSFSSSSSSNSNSSLSSPSSNAFRRSSASSVPNSVPPQWQPSERVLRMKPDQIEDVRLRLNVDVTVASDSSPALAPIESFTDMCLHQSIMKDIAIHGYTTPTPIQAQAMPVALSGRDMLGCAETGSGKTAAFSIPMIQHCLAQPPVCRGDGPLALVLAPTRELAQQIEKEIKAFSRSLESFKTAIVVGGTNIYEQVMRSLPEKHQTLLFSATMPVEIEALAQDYLTKPVQVRVGNVSSPTANVSQTLNKVSESEKIDRLLALLVEEASQAGRSGRSVPLTIVFVERKTRCDEVAEALVAQDLHAVALHGGRSQSEREAALREFRNGSTNILVATDVASRGLDVTGVTHVINLDLPKTMEDYVHRIGRTGRAGSMGQATSFYTDRDMVLVAQIKKAIADVESGNPVNYAVGKDARRKEREAAASHKEARTALSNLSVMGPRPINIEDKYMFMIAASNVKGEGAADSAWDD
ncbi:hypothetical protein SO802_018562 [Lithocarpus litseifolius]|uniref:RNA helicase n=1 Tax=Lithocarpus litseifolius TaxID=425828 RepID=A0AAW2CQE0_9ROSI